MRRLLLTFCIVCREQVSQSALKKLLIANRIKDTCASISYVWPCGVVVDVDHEGEDECDVNDDEENPKEDVRGEVADHLKSKSEADPHEHKVPSGGNVGVTELVDLEEDQHCDGVHEGGVKLEVLGSGTDVVAAGENPLHDESTTHGVEDAVGLGDAAKLWMRSRVFTCICEFFLGNQRLTAELLVFSASVFHDQDEEESTNDVANVAEDVAEVCNWSPRVETEEVEVARVHVALLQRHVLVIQDQLEHRESVVDSDYEDVPDKLVRPLPKVVGEVFWVGTNGHVLDHHLAVGSLCLDR